MIALPLLAEVANTGWRKVRIGDVATLTAGGTPSTSRPEFWNGEIPWMASGDVHKKRVSSVDGRITQHGLANSSAKWIPINSVLIALAGQGKTRGTVAISKIPLTTNQSIAAIMPEPEKLDSEYLFHNLNARYQELRSLSSGNGRAGLNLQIIRDIELVLPPLTVQRYVANVLTSVDECIQATATVIVRLTELKRGLMQQLLSRGVPGRHEEFKHTKLGKIPIPWSLRRFGALASFRNGINFSKGANGQTVRMLGVGDFGDRFRLSNVSHLQLVNVENELDKQAALAPGDLVFVRSNGNKALIGRCILIDSVTQSFTHSGFTIRARVKEPGVLPEYIAWLFRTSAIKLKIAKGGGGTNISNLSQAVLSNIELPLPPIAEQQEICAVLSSVESQIAAEQFKKTRLETVKLGLMQQLLTGELRVPVHEEVLV